jgi:acyl-CoA synthetase (AMP-forming)/AMP-acid ligase II
MSGAKKNLAGYKIPRYIAFPELLKTLTRKFQKLKLREVAKRM